MSADHEEVDYKPHAGRRPRLPMTPEVRISKALSSTLRHNAAEEGLKLRTDGYADVNELLAMQKFRSLGLTFSRLQELVASNDKQRFTLTQEEGSPGTWLVRANQGHSLTITGEGLQLEPLPRPGVCVHGTYYAFYAAILASGGLSRMRRMHIHLSALEGYMRGGIVSGMRADAEVVVVVDGNRAVRDGGLTFWRSANGVVLTPGDADGRLPLEFVLRIEDRKGGFGVLWQDGEEVKELPEALRGRRAPRGKGWLERGGRGGGGRRGSGRGRGRGSGSGSGTGGEMPETGGLPIDAGDL